ncbi:protoheme IX farnesyltransferase [Pseudoxanthobacter sp.]|uniref:protoheme IX farnesyltransferase n=1 Tax=Pseudoxanthobacter sp. TaxID=1925742 RepID=UPI002FE30A13
MRPSAGALENRRRRSLALAGTLVALVVLFYVVTLVKMGQHEAPADPPATAGGL